MSELPLGGIEHFFDEHGLGQGPVSAAQIGTGHSNLTYRLERGGERFVLRRPPPPPLPPSAHDMLREARLQRALEPVGVRVPHVVAICEDEALLAVPFYVMDALDGVVLEDELPPALDSPDARRRIGDELVDALIEIHAVDWRTAGLDGFGRPDGYLERQVRRFAGLWDVNRTRDLPQVGALATWLEHHRPESQAATVVHGEYRLGNVMLAPAAPARLIAVLDWELATLGDPLADLGYLVATYSEPGEAPSPLGLSPVTAQEGFPSRAELVARYEERSGRRVAALPWYEALALWKAAVFCEAIWGRYLRGEKEGDAFAASLGEGVPRMLDAAAEAAARL